MELFNRKEEVLDIQLTQYGKHKLSKGKFKPVYYAFFDDDIIYDTNHGDNGYEEVQKESEDRIKSALRPKAQPITYGIESFISRIQDIAKYAEQQGAINSANDYAIEMLTNPPPSKLNNYTLTNPLGTSELNSYFLPYWNLSSLVGEIKSSSEYLTGSHDVERIPQIDIDIFYETFISKGNLTGDDDEEGIGVTSNGELFNLNVDGVATTPGSPESYEDTSVYAPTTYDDGTQVLIRRGFSLTDLIEGHTNDSIENFDIEVYETTVQIEDGKETEHIKKLKFRNNEHLELGQNKVFSENLNNNVQIDSNYVEYYFEIKVDDEIEDVVRALAPDTEEIALPTNNFGEPCED